MKTKKLFTELKGKGFEVELKSLFDYSYDKDNSAWVIELYDYCNLTDSDIGDIKNTEPFEITLERNQKRQVFALIRLRHEHIEIAN